MKIGGIDLKDIFDLPNVIIGSLITIIAFWKKIKSWYGGYKERRKVKKEIPSILKNLDQKLDTIDSRLKKVEYQVSPNGSGSMRDKIAIIQAEIEASNWLSPNPSFRTTSSGVNIFVNEAYCELCGCNSDELLKLSWRNFANDEEQMDEYYKKWLESSKTLSQFVSKLKYKNRHGEYKGEWIIRIRPLGPIIQDGESDYLWHGTLYPSDEIAMEHQNRFGNH